MKSKSFLPRRSTTARVLLCALAVALGAGTAQAGEKVIFAFSGTQGVNPNTGLVSDSAGNFYGTVQGGVGNCSKVYELSPNSDGTYTETVLYTFQNCIQTGNYPTGTLSLDKKGNLYGAIYGFAAADGSGSVYELLKQANGTFSFKVLHNFGANEGGPFGDFAWDSAGNFYGATSHDSTTFNGEVFEMSPQSNGTWKESVLVTFPTATGVGSPSGSVVLDSQGNLYGATFDGTGGYNSSTRGGIYELSPQADDSWKFTLLYNFTTASKSQFPESRLTFDSNGNLYGIAQGRSYYGSVFEVSPSTGGTWTATTLHTFTAGNDGADPVGNLVFDGNGNLYGVAYDGGTGCNRNLCGVVYKLTPQSGGGYTESIEHSFESASDGSIPYSTLILGNDGNLYGTTAHGGSRYGYGTVYQITPQ